MLMKALTIQQPWIWWIMQPENNTVWQQWPGGPKIRGYFLLHAGMGWDFEAEQWMTDKLNLVIPPILDKAYLVAYARLANVTLAGQRFPKTGFAFHLTDIQELSQPTIAVGRRGFWPVPQHILKNLTIPDYVTRQAL